MERARVVRTFHDLQRDPAFEQAVAKRGGSLSPTIYADEDHYQAKHFRQLFEEPLTNVANLVEWISEEVPEARPLLERVRMGYVCNALPQAFIERKPDIYVIGVHSGLVDVIAQAVFTFFSSGDTFTRIGGPATEWAGEARFRLRHPKDEEPIDVEKALGAGFNPWAVRGLEGGGYRFPEFPTPMNQERDRAAHLMACYAIEFAFLHELGHLLAGHFEQFTGVATITDGAAKSPTSLSKDENHILELDADSMAVQFAAAGGLIAPLPWSTPAFRNLFRDASSLASTPMYPGEFQPGGGFFDRNTLCYLWSAATSLLMLSFAQHEIPVRQWPSNDHPHPLYRVLHFVSTLQSCRMGNDPVFSDALNSWGESLRDLIQAWTAHQVPGTKLLRLADAEITELTATLEGLYDRTVRSPDGIIKQMERNKFRVAGESFFRRLVRDAPKGLQAPNLATVVSPDFL